MGAVRYLCITIFLVFLCSVQALELDAETTPMAASGCGANGRPIGTNFLDGKCLCESGYGGAECETDVLGAASCAAVTADQLDKIKLYPDLSTKQDKIDFTANTMTLNIYGEYVANRTYTAISFVEQENTTDSRCYLGTEASVWAISADTVECKDKISMQLPWSHHKKCGFFKTANTALHYQYKATIKLQYTDEVGIVYDKPDETVEANRKISLQRHTTVSYEVFIRFLRRVEVNVTEVLVQSVVNQRVAITAVLFNPDTQEVQVDVAVFTVWPNMLLDDNDHDVTVYAPEGVTLRSSTATSQDIDCPLTAVGTAQPQCYQRLTFFIDTRPNCTFDGEYTLTSTVVTCRADYPTCTKNITYIDFTIHGSNVCGEVTAEPIVSGKLVAFEDSEHTVPTTNFLLGEYGYFATEFNSVNTVSMSYISIWVTEVDSNGAETGDDIYLYENFKTVTDYSSYNPEIINPYEDEGHGPTRLQINELSVNENDPNVANDVVVKTPHFSFLFHSAIFTTPAGGRKVYNVHATGNVTYLGNEQYNKHKREQTVVNFVWKVDTATMDSSVQVGVASKASAQVAGPQSSNNNVSVLAAVLPVAGVALVAIVGAAVVAAIIVKRRKAATSFQTFNSIAIN